jgi:hypothetical protein
MGAALVLLALAGTITPSGPAVPANLLCIEVHLPRALAPQATQPAITLRDAAGVPIGDALLDIILPDRDERSLVVLLQPGRIKHGVGPNLALGPALHEGDRVSIEVSDPRLPRSLTRTWRVGPARAQAIVPAFWTVHAPGARSKAPLILDLPAAINASAAALIGVAGPDGRRVAGTAVLAAGETQWRFVPAAPWQPGRYQVRVHPGLEDPAGNRMCAAFEERMYSARQCADEITIDFQSGAP